MAAVWEVHIISEKAISYEILALIIQEYGDALRVREIVSIDDWEWSNRRQLDRVEEITEALDKGKIITIEMQSEKWKSLGMYAEKERLSEIKGDCLPVVLDAILKRELIKSTMLLPFEIIFCTALFLFPNRIC